MRINREVGLEIVKVILLILSFYLLLKFVLFPILTSEQFKVFIANMGIFGYLILIGYMVLADIVAPLGTAPAVVLGIALYGFETSMVLLYFASQVSAVVNFKIGRLYGRSLVIRLVGKKSMTQIDEFIEIEGKDVLLVSRIFGFPIFEYISYAAGLTKIPFKDYITITILASLIPNIIFYLIFRNVNFESESGITLWIASIIISGIAFVALFKSYLQKKKQRK